MADQRLAPFARILVVMGTFALGCAASAGLWLLWTGRCNEACPDRTVAGMMVFLALLPTLATLVAVLLVSMAWPVRVKAAIAGALLALGVGAAIWIDLLAGASAAAAGLR